MVEMEQKAVTAITEQYFKNLPSEQRAEIMSEISEKTNSAASILGRARVNSTARVVRDLFPNGDYDFSNQDHRSAVGRALVDLKYADSESE